MYKRVIGIIWGIIIILNIAAWRFHAFCDWYTEHITPIWVNTFGRLTGIFPRSVGEFMILVGLFLTLALLVVSLLFLFLRKKKGFSFFARRFYKFYGACFTGVCLVMTLNCTILYHCTPIRAGGYAAREYGTEDLEKVRNHIVQQCNYYSGLVERDENGAVVYDGNIQKKAKQTMRKLSYAYPKLSGYYPNLKPLVFSDLLSQAYTAGYYFPFSMEANYNVNMYICNYPQVYCHELAHLHGYIHENEANFLSFRACVESDDVFFIYSGYLSVLNYVENEYWSNVDNDAAMQNNPPFPNALVMRDNIFLDKKTWEKVNENAVFSTDFVEHTSDRLTDGSMKLNGVSDGMESYGRVVLLLLEYYDGQL